VDASAGGRVKILDFGLTRPVADSDLSLPGSVVGTPAYMAPEQARGETVDARADLFSLGCVLYRMATGEPAFAGKTPWAVLRAVEEHQPPPPRSLRPELPAALQTVIMDLLAKEPDRRPASAGEVARTLRAVLAQADGKAPLPQPQPPALPQATAHPSGGRTTETFPPVARPPRADRTGVHGRPRAWKTSATKGRARRAIGIAVGALVLLLVTLGGYLVANWQSADPSPLVPGPLQAPLAANTSPSPREPLKGSLDVVVARGSEGTRRYLSLTHAETLPLKVGDYVRIEARLNRPAYAYLLWVDTEGQVTLLFPWDKERKQRPEAEQPVAGLFYPAPESAAPLPPGPPGTETLLLLAREEPLPRDVDFGRLFAQLRPQPSRHPREAAWFENGRLVHGDKDRGAINFEDRAAPLDNEQLLISIDDPVLQVQALLRTQLKDVFPYSRAVCFSNAGSP